MRHESKNPMEIKVTDATFQKEVLEAETLVLVDFWAPWCGPCKMMNPVLEEIAKQYEGKLKVAKVNVDENMERPSEFGIMSIPTMLFFKNGAVVDQTIGAMPKEALTARIEKVLGA